VLSAHSSLASSPVTPAAPATVFDRFASSSSDSTTDVAATKAKTRGALLGGLKSGALEAAVAKMEEDLDNGVEEG
jgi:hypothetical protein